MNDHLPHLVSMDALLVGARSALPHAPQVLPTTRLPRTRQAGAASLRVLADRLQRVSARLAPPAVDCAC